MVLALVARRARGERLGTICLIRRHSGVFFVGSKVIRVLEQGDGPWHLFGSAAC